MDNAIYKLFPLLVLSCYNHLVLLIQLLVLPCLSDLVLIQHITICTSTVHTSIRTDTTTRLPENITNKFATEIFHFLVNKVLSTNIYIFSPFYSLPPCAVIIQFTLLFKIYPYNNCDNNYKINCVLKHY